MRILIAELLLCVITGVVQHCKTDGNIGGKNHNLAK